jgi:type II secretory pathway component PulF
MVFDYEAISIDSEEYDEVGVVVAQDRDEAEKKLRKMGFAEIHLKRVRGFKALLKALRANIK